VHTYFVGKLRERNYLEELSIDVTIILKIAASVSSNCLQLRRSRLLIDRCQHVSECLICFHVCKWNVSESVAGSVQVVLGAFVNWRETAVGFVISVRLSVCLCQLVCVRTEFCEILCFFYYLFNSN
jgi:hypothetical protein